MVAPKVHTLLNPADYGSDFWSDGMVFTLAQSARLAEFASAVIGEINLWHMSIEIIGDRRYVTLGIIPEGEPEPQQQVTILEEGMAILNDEA